MTNPTISLLTSRLEISMNLTSDLFEKLEKNDLSLNLPSLPSNKFGEQIWCIIGARQSYYKAIINNEWMGFSCSLKDIYDKSEINNILKKTSLDLLTYVRSNQLIEIQLELIFKLFEHEIQHHGQLIRLVYANRLEFPQSWKDRYTV